MNVSVKDLVSLASSFAVYSLRRCSDAVLDLHGVMQLRPKWLSHSMNTL